ncbi:MAG: hypothetical protein IJU79_02040 [Desulfovibrionaceae bacterium]|nr:hypothetical protein [Desulfovibrionaceae bacterium]
MDKEQKEALQVTKELTAKFIETRTISPENFAKIFPMIYRVVSNTLQDHQTLNETQVERELKDKP